MMMMMMMMMMMINEEQIEIRQCLLSFGAESFVFQFAIQKLKIKIDKTVILPAALPTAYLYTT